MKSKMTMKHKATAYLLNKGMGYTMKAIGTLMGVSQSTVSKGIKDFETERTINDLTTQLEEARANLKALGYTEPDVLPPNNNNFIDVNFNELD